MEFHYGTYMPMHVCLHFILYSMATDNTLLNTSSSAGTNASFKGPLQEGMHV